MWFKKLLFLLSALMVSSSAPPRFEKNVTINFQNQDIWTSLSTAIEDVLYSICDYKRSGRASYVCNVTLATPSSEKTCGVNVTSWWRQGDNNYHHRLQFLTNDTVLWTQYHTQDYQSGLTLYIVRMSDCRVTPIQVPQVKWFALREAMANGDHFDLVYTNKFKGNDTISTVGFNLDGEIVSRPRELTKTPEFKREENWNPLVVTPDSIYYQKGNVGVYKIVNGTATQVLGSNSSVSLIAAENSRLSFCSRRACDMYDYQGKHLVWFPLGEFRANVSGLATYNTRSGRMVVAIFEMKKDGESQEDVFTATIVLAEEDSYRQPQVFSYKEVKSVKKYGFSEDHEQICLKMVMKSYSSPNETTRFTVDCIPNIN